MAGGGGVAVPSRRLALVGQSGWVGSLDYAFDVMLTLGWGYRQASSIIEKSLHLPYLLPLVVCKWCPHLLSFLLNIGHHRRLYGVCPVLFKYHLLSDISMHRSRLQSGSSI